MSFPFQSQICLFLPQDGAILTQVGKFPSLRAHARRSKGYAFISQNHSDAPAGHGPQAPGTLLLVAVQGSNVAAERDSHTPDHQSSTPAAPRGCCAKRGDCVSSTATCLTTV